MRRLTVKGDHWPLERTTIELARILTLPLFFADAICLFSFSDGDRKRYWEQCVQRAAGIGRPVVVFFSRVRRTYGGEECMRE